MFYHVLRKKIIFGYFMTKRICPDSSTYIPNPVRHLGNFNVLPDEVIAQIISRAFSPDEVPIFTTHPLRLVCKTFQVISEKTLTFNFCLNNLLEEKTNINFNLFFNYIHLFKRVFEKTPIPNIFIGNPNLVDVETSYFTNESLKSIIDWAKEAHHQIKSLHLRSSLNFEKFDIINQFVSIKELALYDCNRLGRFIYPLQELDFSMLTQLERFKLINCCSLTTSIKLNTFICLKELCVENCDGLEFNLMSLSKLLDLSKLKILSLKEGITFGWIGKMDCWLDLKEFPQLETLRLGLYLTRLLNLNNLILLKIIDLSNCIETPAQIDLNGLDQLEELRLACVSLTELPILKTLSQLKILHLKQGKQWLERLDLDGLDQLQELCLFDWKELADLPNLQNKKELRNLALRNCKFKELNVSGLVNLKKFFLDGCNNLSGLPNLDQLRSLEMLGFRDLHGWKGALDLSGLVNLKQLFLDTCNVSELLNLNQLRSLEVLDLCNLSELKGALDLSGLVNLKKLFIEGCDNLTDLLNLDQLRSLEFIDLEEFNGLDLTQLPSSVQVYEYYKDEDFQVDDYLDPVPGS